MQNQSINSQIRHLDAGQQSAIGTPHANIPRINLFKVTIYVTLTLLITNINAFADAGSAPYNELQQKNAARMTACKQVDEIQKQLVRNTAQIELIEKFAAKSAKGKNIDLDSPAEEVFAGGAVAGAAMAATGAASNAVRGANHSAAAKPRPVRLPHLPVITSNKLFRGGWFVMIASGLSAIFIDQVYAKSEHIKAQRELLPDLEADYHENKEFYEGLKSDLIAHNTKLIAAQNARNNTINKLASAEAAQDPALRCAFDKQEVEKLMRIYGGHY